jgi:hypothetical protein
MEFDTEQFTEWPAADQESSFCGLSQRHKGLPAPTVPGCTPL